MDRVKGVLNYKKPMFWIILAGVVACIALSICFLTNSQKEGAAKQEEVLQETDGNSETSAQETMPEADGNSETSAQETMPEAEKPSEEVKPALESHEEQLKKIVNERIKGVDLVIGYWGYADYDGDGNKEAFAQIKSGKEGNDGSYSELYFIDSYGLVTTTVGKFFRYYFQPVDVDICQVLTTPDEKSVFAIDETDWKQGVTRVFGVKDGKPYEMTISEMDELHGIYQEDGKIWTIPDKYSESYVDGAKIMLQYENGEFTALEYNAEIALYKKYCSAMDENEIVYRWRYDDYDGNGTKEAFAVISPIDCTGVVKRIDYIDAEGNVTEAADDGDGLQSEYVFTAPDGKRFFEYATGTGAENCYRTLGVKNGKPYELQFSGYACKYNDGIREENGKFYTTAGSYCTEDDPLYSYILTYENGEFYPPNEYYFNYVGTVLYQYVGMDENIVIPRKCQDGTVFTEITDENYQGYGHDFTCMGLRGDEVNFKSIEIPETITKIADGTVGFDEKGMKFENFTIRCKSGSEAERYAKANGFLIEYYE